MLKKSFGKYIIASGLLLHVIQLLAGYIRESSIGTFLTGPLVSLIMTCAVAGGLAVYAYEVSGVRTCLSVAAAIDSLLVIMLGNLPGGGAVTVAANISYFLFFLLLAAILLASSRFISKLLGAVALLLGSLVALQLFSILSLSGPVLMFLFVCIYGAVFAGILVKE